MSVVADTLFPRPVLTAIRGENADLIHEAAGIYLFPGMVVADVTYGRGSFWTSTNTQALDFRPTDLVDGIDCRSLPYADAELDVLVLDPPYMPSHDGDVKPSIADQYRLNGAGAMRSAPEVADFYGDALTEARRVVKRGGTVWVKCQDVVENHRNHWLHVAVYEHALAVGFQAEDLFVLVQAGQPTMRQQRQEHARKNHSFLWVFRV